MPQYIVGNCRSVTPSMVRTWAAGGGDCRVRLWRKKSAWLTGKDLSAMIRDVARAIGPLTGRRVIFSMDACPVHLTAGVLRTLTACGWHLLPIAAQMTKYLQPADVGVFLPLKRRYRTLYEREQLLRRCGEIAPERALRLLADATQDIVGGGSWGPTFRRCGLSAEPPTSARFLAALGPEPLAPLTPGVPSLKDLSLVLPRRRHVPVALLFALFLESERRRPFRGVPRASGPDAPRLRPSLAFLPRPRESLARAHARPAPTTSPAGTPAPSVPHIAHARRLVPVGVRLLPWPPAPLPRPRGRPS